MTIITLLLLLIISSPSLTNQPHTEPDADVPPFLLWWYHPTRTEGLLPCHDWLPPLARRSHAPPLWTVHAAAEPSDGSEGTDERVQPHEQSPHTAPCWAEDGTARHTITAGREQLQQTVLSLCYCEMSSFYYSETVIFIFAAYNQVQPECPQPPSYPAPSAGSWSGPAAIGSPSVWCLPTRSPPGGNMLCVELALIFCDVKRWY